MSGKRYTEQFMNEAAGQITDHRHVMGDVAK
jgi:hypothetical protein